MKTATTKILFLLMALWVLLSFFNVLYNVSKSVTEIKEWGFLSDTKKRQKIFGNLYSFITLIDKNTKNNSRILIIAKENMPYYLSRYYLYPKKIYYTDDKKYLNQIDKQKKFEYIAAYKTNINLSNYKKIAIFTSNTSTEYGTLFIIK